MELKRYTKHILSEEDQATIKTMAETISKQKREEFQKVRFDKDMPFYDMNLNGFGAELSFCRLCNVPFDSSTIENANHFNMPDCIVEPYGIIDVKTTKYKTGVLLAGKHKKESKANAYALMVGSFPEYVFMGWAYKEELFKEENLRDLGKGTSYCLSQDRLRHILVCTNP